VIGFAAGSGSASTLVETFGRNRAYSGILSAIRLPWFAVTQIELATEHFLGWLNRARRSCRMPLSR